MTESLAFLAAPANMPFSVALAVLLLLGLLEGVGTLVGVGLSTVLDKVAGKLGMTVEVDADALEGPSLVSKLLAWLRVRDVPVVVVLIVFLAVFGLGGLAAQAVLVAVTGAMLPALIAVWPVAAASLPLVRMTTGALAKILPRDETSAVSVESFVGRTGVVTIGVARRGSPAQARVKDEHGHTHYFMVEPLDAGEELAAGDSVLLMARAGTVFRAAKAAPPALVKGTDA